MEFCVVLVLVYPVLSFFVQPDQGSRVVVMGPWLALVFCDSLLQMLSKRFLSSANMSDFQLKIDVEPALLTQ